MAVDEMAGVCTEGDEVGRIEFPFGVFVERLDVVDFYGTRPPARDARWFFFKVPLAYSRPFT